MTRRTMMWLGGSLLAVTIVALGTTWFLDHFERRSVSVTLPDRGEASYDDFYVLRRLLQVAGQPARAATRLDAPLHRGDTLVIGAGAGRLSPRQSQRLAAWVHRGGHLVLRPRPVAASAVSPLFHALGLSHLERAGFGCIDVQGPASAKANAKDARIRLCGARFSGLPVAPSAAVGDADSGFAYARLPMGKGTVSLLDDLGPLSGHAPLKKTARRFDLGVLQPNAGKGVVVLAYAISGPSFWQAMFRHGWPALLALTLLLLAWASARSQRLGPLCPLPPRHRRALLEHVRAAGEFLYRRDGGHTLHARAMATVWHRWLRRDPSLAHLEGADLHEHLARRSGLDAADIAQALSPPANAAAFRQALSVLARLART